MRSRVRVISAIGCALLSLAALGCEKKLERPKRNGGCEPGAVLTCFCPGGQSRGFTTCGAAPDAPCGGCAPVSAVGGSNQVSASAPALAAGAGAANGGAGAGSFAPRPAGSPSSLPGAVAGAPPITGPGCATGEMCKTTAAGTAKFCTANPLAATPAPCATPNQPCGTKGSGICVDATPHGAPGLFYCVNPTC